jgi:simple sugar transport system permease protein
MAVPNQAHKKTEPRSTATGLVRQLRSLGDSLSRPLFAIVLALLAGSIVIFFTANGGPEDRLNTVFLAYQSLFTGSYGDLQGLSYTLIRVGALILAGISVALAARVGLFNIGAAGQLTVGALTAGIIGLSFTSWPGYILIPTMIIGSALAGAVWGGIVGLLKAWRGAHEVVTTIMLNWIAFYLADYFITGPYKSAQALVTNSLPKQAQLPQIATFYNQTLGQFLGLIPDPQQYLVDVTFLFSLVALVIYWFLVSRTTYGYEIRVIGQNPGAARYAGIRTGRQIVVTMALAGAFAGLAGSFHLMGQYPYYLLGGTFASDPTGFDAIGVALLGNNTAIGILLASLLFGGLRQGSLQMQLNANVPGDLVYIIQALVLFCIAANFLPAIQRTIARWRHKPALAVAGAGEVVRVDAPVVGSSFIENKQKPAEDQEGEQE